MHYCDLVSDQEYSLSVFDFHNIHGVRIRDYNTPIVVFGDISIAIVVFNEGKLELLCVDQLDDMVVDCMLLNPHAPDLTLAVAYGHNMVDICTCSRQSSAISLAHRYWHPDITVLFAASFYVPPSSSPPQPLALPSSSSPSPSPPSPPPLLTSYTPSSHITIASGTIFGYLSIWQVPVHSPTPTPYPDQSINLST
ncbi:hypothetical protein EON63_22665, partial [archaeon]